LYCKVGKLRDAEKAELADVNSGASFSLSDGHGDILGALKGAYEKSVEVNLNGENEKSGSRKSEDKEYGAKMDVEPKDAYAKLVEGTISKQGIPDTVSGATALSSSFNALLESVLTDMALKGTTEGAIPNK
jgi:hypothetical protein